MLLFRQGTPYDDYCNKLDEKGLPVGSRIHGDCDKLMKVVMQEILGEEELKKWEAARDSRIKEYNRKREE